MISSQEILLSVPNLKPLPDTAMQVIKAVNNQKGSMDDVVNVVHQDQILTAKVLRIANSASFSLNREITSLRDALIYLGTSKLVQIILLAVPDSPLLDKVEGYGLKRGELWLHSASAAIAAQYLGSLVKFPDLNLLFTAGLLHDIGKCLLQAHVGREYETLMMKVQDEGLDFVQAEREVFGIDHAEVGGIVADVWNLPSDIRRVIRHHHMPMELDPVDQAVDLIYLGDTLSLLMGAGIGRDGLNYRAEQGVLERNDIKPEEIEKACAVFLHEMISLKEVMLVE